MSIVFVFYFFGIVPATIFEPVVPIKETPGMAPGNAKF